MREKSKGIKLYKSDYKNLIEILNTLKKIKPYLEITKEDIETLNFLDEEEKEYCMIKLNPGVYELKDLNEAIQQQVNIKNKYYKNYIIIN